MPLFQRATDIGVRNCPVAIHDQSDPTFWSSEAAVQDCGNCAKAALDHEPMQAAVTAMARSSVRKIRDP